MKLQLSSHDYQRIPGSANRYFQVSKDQSSLTNIHVDFSRELANCVGAAWENSMLSLAGNLSHGQLHESEQAALGNACCLQAFWLDTTDIN